ncbi:hypothetical protein P692DRAFT_201873228 [Suillus brevipes Sb2]|nr:hypothetical protein P692DRAFT_201873228 [Suillus brevipes Sb2]
MASLTRMYADPDLFPEFKEAVSKLPFLRKANVFPIDPKTLQPRTRVNEAPPVFEDLELITEMVHNLITLPSAEFTPVADIFLAFSFILPVWNQFDKTSSDPECCPSFVQAFGEFLTSEEDRLRMKGVEFLSSILRRCPHERLNRQAICVLTMFYCSKLEDLESIIPRLSFLAIYEIMKRMGSLGWLGFSHFGSKMVCICPLNQSVPLTTISATWSCSPLTELWPEPLRPSQSAHISFGATSTGDYTNVNAVSAFVSRKLSSVLHGQAIVPDVPPPLELLCGHVSQPFLTRFISALVQQSRNRNVTPLVNIMNTPLRSSSFNINGPFPSSSPVSSLDSGSQLASGADFHHNLESQLKASPIICDLLDRLQRCEYNTREIQRDISNIHRKVNILIERTLSNATSFNNAQPEFKDPFAPASGMSTPAVNIPRASFSANIAPNQSSPADDITQISQRLNMLTTSVGQLLALQTQQHIQNATTGHLPAQMGRSTP